LKRIVNIHLIYRSPLFIYECPNIAFLPTHMNAAGAKKDNRKQKDIRDPILAPLPNNHSLEDIYDYAGKRWGRNAPPFATATTRY
jgi:hypothetical protein